MTIERFSVKDFMVLTPLFVYKESTLYNAFEIMKFYDSENIAVIDEEFKIQGVITRTHIIRELNFDINLRDLKSITISTIIGKWSNTPVSLYTGTSLYEAYSIMKCLNVRGLPVADVPWDKRIKGYLWLEDIASQVHSNELIMSSQEAYS